MKKFTRNEDGHIIFDNSENVNISKVRKEQHEKAKQDSASIVVLNRQVRRALDQITKLEERIVILEKQ